MKFIINILTITLLFASTSNSQISKNTTYHPFSNAFVFTAEFGGTLAYTDFANPELDFTGRILTEYFFYRKPFTRLVSG